VRDAPPRSGDAGIERAFARQTIKRLSMPWDELFDALEASGNGSIALLAIEPDAEARTVSLSGEAKDYLSALTYVANLGEQKTLTRVHLVRHELRQSGAVRPVAFVVSASWGAAP
jgi:Tfp pilus assembly protein PilN